MEKKMIVECHAEIKREWITDLCRHMDKFHRNNVESNPKIYAIEYYSYEIQENTTVTYAI